MMLKFRARHKKHKEWIPGEHVLIKGNGHILYYAQIGEDDFDWIDAEDELDIEFFTGRFDCNGTEIWKGDIAKALRGEQGMPDSEFYAITCIVSSRNGGFVLFEKPIQLFTDNYENSMIRNAQWVTPYHFNCPEIYHEIRNVEIVGNQHDNPELLT